MAAFAPLHGGRRRSLGRSTHAVRRAVLGALLVGVLAALPGLSPVRTAAGASGDTGSVVAAASGPPTTLQFRPAPGPVAYIGRPFGVTVAIVDEFMAVVTEGTSATVTLAIETSPTEGAVLACTSGLSLSTETIGPAAGTVTFSGCTIDRLGTFYYLQAATSSVVSTIVPTPTIGPARGASIRVAPAIEAPQESIKVSTLFDGPYFTWGMTVTVRIVFTDNGANKPFQLQQSTRTMQTWTPLAELVTNESGVATYAYRPSVTTRYRAVFAGSPDLAGGTSAPAGILLLSFAKQVPTPSTPKVIRCGTTITFATTIRPLLPELSPARVLFRIYHRVSGAWKLASSRYVAVDATGVARFRLKFGSRGEWYVRSNAEARWIDADSMSAPAVAWASRPTPIARYSVR